MTEVDGRIEELYDRATETVEEIGSKADEDDLGPVLSLLDDLEDVADEAEDLLSTVDLTRIAATVDWSDLPEALELEDVPEAISEGDVGEAVTLRELVALSDLPALWDDVDVREAWREKRELSEEVDDLAGDGRGDDDAGGMDASMPSAGGHDFDPASIENAVQSEVSESVGEFREKLLDAHDRLAEVRERNQERFPDRRRDRSRNPTAVSTAGMGARTSGGGARHSTVPEETRYSTAPNRERIYGTRFGGARGSDDE